ncbi:MAG: hypothetical protein HQ596_05225 [Candidatus Saganbacteria bacterium]|nr:hypothetical protein [Candidatus Saganbacteria bacterium]
MPIGPYAACYRTRYPNFKIRNPWFPGEIDEFKGVQAAGRRSVYNQRSMMVIDYASFMAMRKDGERELMHAKVADIEIFLPQRPMVLHPLAHEGRLGVIALEDREIETFTLCLVLSEVGQEALQITAGTSLSELLNSNPVNPLHHTFPLHSSKLESNRAILEELIPRRLRFWERWVYPIEGSWPETIPETPLIDEESAKITLIRRYMRRQQNAWQILRLDPDSRKVEIVGRLGEAADYDWLKVVLPQGYVPALPKPAPPVEPAPSAPNPAVSPPPKAASRPAQKEKSAPPKHRAVVTKAVPKVIPKRKDRVSLLKDRFEAALGKSDPQTKYTTIQLVLIDLSGLTTLPANQLRVRILIHLLEKEDIIKKGYMGSAVIKMLRDFVSDLRQFEEQLIQAPEGREAQLRTVQNLLKRASEMKGL